MAIAAPPKRKIEELVEYLGGIPRERIRTSPEPGKATVEDVVYFDVHEDRLCELIDGILVEKTVGLYESALGYILGGMILNFVQKHKLGMVAGEAGMMRILPDQVRIPDISFISKERLANQKIRRDPVPEISPDLAVEILSEGNTKREMDRKLREYFEGGTRLVWYVDPVARTVSVYTSTERVSVLSENSLLTGGDVLVGFEVRVGDVFEEADESFEPGAK
jgi:Uma2 family endonuclease